MKKFYFKDLPAQNDSYEGAIAWVKVQGIEYMSCGPIYDSHACIGVWVDSHTQEDWNKLGKIVQQKEHTNERAKIQTDA